MHIEHNDYEMTEWDILLWTVSHSRRLEDNMIAQYFYTMLRILYR